MLYKVEHITEYKYGFNVSISHNIACLTPQTTYFQLVHSASVNIKPTPNIRSESVDYFGNKIQFFSLEEPYNKLIVHAKSIVEINTKHILPDPESTPPWESVRDQLSSFVSLRDNLLEYAEFLYPSTYINFQNEQIYHAILSYALDVFTPNKPILLANLELMQKIHKDFKFDPTATNVATPLKDIIQKRRGVCQDFAHFQIACLRALRLPARYASGYLLTSPPPGMPRLIGADMSHAWVSTYCPDYGWVDLDPTNNQVANQTYVTVAYGRDYSDVSPVKGVILGGSQHTLRVSVDVEPIEEIPES